MDNFLTTEQADEIFYASVEGLTLDVDDYEFDAETSAHIYIDEVGNWVEVRSDGSVVEIPSEDM